MHKYEAEISWKRQGAKFSDNRYSRGHEWSFDGGVKIMASSSPSVVPAPYSVVEAVDPEEALVASAASCHMLWFLWIASRRGFVVESYTDKATGIMEKESWLSRASRCAPGSNFQRTVRHPLRSCSLCITRPMTNALLPIRSNRKLWLKPTDIKARNGSLIISRL
jgi:organic hydroperoxide reductase OsmC/OhrA